MNGLFGNLKLACVFAFLFSTNCYSTVIQIDLSASVDEIWTATPNGDGTYTFDYLSDTPLAGFNLQIGQSITARILYDTNGIETDYSQQQNDPTYHSYWALLGFELSIDGHTYGNSNLPHDYLAIYNNGLFSNVDAFYTSLGYFDDFAFNILRMHLFANSSLWDTLSIPEELDLGDFYYRRLSGVFLRNEDGIHVNWGGNIQTLITSPASTPIPTPTPLVFIAFMSAFLYLRRGRSSFFCDVKLNHTAPNQP